MYTHNDTVFVGTSELRSNGGKILQELKNKKIVLMNKGKAIAIIESLDEYEKTQNKIEEIEDLVLGHIAKERMKNGKFISSDEMQKLLFS